MNKQAIKKNHEFELLSEFKARYLGFPHGEIIHSESPDFIIDSVENRIGIEISEIHTPIEANKADLRQQESIAKQIMQIAENSYQEFDKGQFSVMVEFLLEMPLTDKGKAGIAAFICEYAKCHKPYYATHEGLLPEIHKISIWRDPRPMGHQKWTSPYSGWFGKLNHENLAIEIGKKESKIQEYEKNVLYNWLLLVADGNELSGSFSYDEMKPDFKFNSKFLKIFIYERFQGQVFELK